MSISSFIFFIFYLLMVSCSSADEKIIMGVEETPYYPHYEFEGSKKRGFAPEIFETFAKMNGYAIEYKIYPIKRLYSEFFSGKIDLKYPDNPNWNIERRSEHNVIYSSSVAKFVDGIMVRPENVGKGIGALKTVSLQSGFTPWTFISLVNSGQISLMENNVLEGAIKQAQIGRSDGVYANVQVVNYLLSEKFLQPGTLIHDTELPSSNGSYHLSSTRREDIIRKFNDFLVKEKLYIEQTRSKYGLQ